MNPYCTNVLSISSAVFRSVEKVVQVERRERFCNAHACYLTSKSRIPTSFELTFTSQAGSTELRYTASCTAVLQELNNVAALGLFWEVVVGLTERDW